MKTTIHMSNFFKYKYVVTYFKFVFNIIKKFWCNFP